jgi:hypothetical protein
VGDPSTSLDKTARRGVIFVGNFAFERMRCMESIPTTPLAIIGTVVVILALIVLYFIKTQGQMVRANNVSDRSEAHSDRSEGRSERSEIRNDEMEKQMITLMADIKGVILGNTEAIRDSRLYMQLLTAGQEQTLKKLDTLCEHASEERGNWRVALGGIDDLKGTSADIFKEMRKDK